ncbi:HD domain-containing protein [Maridesulfovibrio zosterae]|uniref:HD domain-containing protein n=1 Tax=Maridesulfovibrio zosterae TaxID=82171 RepID=UPI00041642A7|nr:HD domain-containing protein [Maridesulfovibrio zosterae]
MEDFKKIFSQFTAPYLENAPDSMEKDFKLKLDHSFNVFKNSQKICDSLDLDHIFSKTIQIAALFHDTGRFPQLQQYGTFKDSDSCNHAILGVRCILKNDLLSALKKERLKIILGAIVLHNRNEIPVFTPYKIKIAAQVVRDSDKIDILKILLSHMENIKPHSMVALMGLPEIPDQITEPVIKAVEEKHQAAYVDMKCVNDFRLLILSWAYDLNFKWSRQEMINRSYLDKIFEQLPKNDRILALYNPIIEQLNS